MANTKQQKLDEIKGRRTFMKVLKTMFIAIPLAVVLFFVTAPLFENVTIPTGATLPFGWSVPSCGDGGPFEDAGWPLLATRFGPCGAPDENHLAVAVDLLVTLGIYLTPTFLFMWLVKFTWRKLVKTHD
jgi:hypothetical protein